jgi:superfamily II DNA or RNA helicase
MISERALKRECSPAILSRARKVAFGGDRLHARRCRYDGSQTVLRAKVDATYSWDDAYRTSVVIDEEDDVLVDYDCNCPAARRFVGPCKHAIALVLDFNDRPDEYEGHDASTHLSTSRGVRRLMERASGRMPAAAGPLTEPVGGTVSLELTLAYETGFDARFRLLGANGAYVVKSLADFVSDVEGGVYRSYGKRLAFTHDREAFSTDSREVVSFLVRAAQNRRAYAFERMARRVGTAGMGSSTLGRELHLSPPELWELLELYEGRAVLFEDRSPSSDGSPTHHVVVVREDPELALGLASAGEGAYELRRTGDVRVASCGGRAVAWDDRTLYMCTERLSRRVDLLSGVWGDPSEPLLVAERDVPAFCATVLPRLEEVLPVAVPDELEALRPAPCRLEFYLDMHEGSATCRAVARYGEVRLPLFGRRDATYGAADVVARDRQAETRGREVVRRYFPVGDGGELQASQAGDAVARVVFEGVEELKRMGEVFVTPRFERLRSEARPRVRVGLSVRSNLLDLALQLDGLPESELAGLLASYRQRKRYHRLRDGSFVRMSDADLAKAGAVAEELGLGTRELARARATVPAYRAFMLAELISDDAKDVTFDDYVNRVRTLDLTRFEVPEPLREVLRPYQVEGFRWLMGLAELGLGGILADEMGLGKSVQLISFLTACKERATRVGPSLVVCPASLVYNWRAEFVKFSPGLRVVVVAGTAEERESLRRTPEADVLVTSYDLLRRDIEAFAVMRLWCVALDEAQYIKNHATLAARAVKSLDAEHRLALTGTPVENRLSELWSIFDFVMPGLLGSYERFRDRYERPIVEEDDAEAAARLRAGIQPFVLRRLKRDVLLDLPEKIEEVVRSHMGTDQRRVYDAQVQDLRAHLSGKSAAAFGGDKIQILAALTRLRQICCDPGLVYEGYDGGSCKVDTILTLVQRVSDAGEKMLVFSQFTSFLDVLAAELDARDVPYLVLTGSTPKRRRVELVDRFNGDATPVFLISLKAGGTGLNLTGASVVVHADPWWNEAAQNQATDRAHRIGQTRDVTVYRVIAQDSIEERILDLQRTKAQLADAVVEGDATGMSLASLTREDLEDLLG